MPASTLDPVKTAIRNVLVKNNNSDYLNSQLTSSAHRVLCTKIDFEPAESYQNDVLNDLKSKYIVLQPNNKSQTQNGRKYESPSQTNAEEALSKPQTVLYPIENVQLGWSDSDWGVGAGMMNMGNTCYLNSTLQALFHVPALVNWLLSDKQHLLQCENNSGGAQSCCIICAVSKTLQASQVKNGNAIRPWLVYSKLRLVCRHLIPGRQEDAHEFLRYLVEAMEKAYILRFRHLGNLDSRSKETTPLNQILGGYLRSTVRCLECGHVSTTFQHFQDLLLDIRKGNTLDEALDLYFSKEKLDDMAYHCDHCKKKVIATKQFTLERAPMVLCIQLKRFSVSNNKITKQITYKPKMDLTRFSRQKTSTPLLYQLVAIVTHMGPTVSCGHYTAVARAASGDYYVFDDSTVRQVSQQTVLNTNAYIMLYEAIRPTTNQNPNPKTQIRVEQTTETNSKNNTIINGGSSNSNSKILMKETIKTNGNFTINKTTNGQNKSSESSDSDLSDNSDKDTKTSNGINNKNILPLPYITSQNFSANGNLNNGNEKNKSSNNQVDSSQSLKNGKLSSESENFVKKWENKYIFNDKKSDHLKTSPLKSENHSKSSPLTSKSENFNSDSCKKFDSNKNFSAKDNSVVKNSNDENNFIKKWENKYVNNQNSSSEKEKRSENSENFRIAKDSLQSSSSKVTTTKLVPYDVNDSSSSSSSDDSNENTSSPENSTIKTKASSSVNNWKVSPILDKPINPSLEGNSGNWKSRTETINELIKMSNEGYAGQVSSWNGTRPHIEKQIANERREERKRCMMDNEDRGKVKHARLSNNNNNNGYQHSSSSTYNPFQAYSNNNRRWNNEPTSNKNNFYSQNKHRYNGQRKMGNHHYNNRYREKFRH